ncbi:hypothetical protein ACS0TY_008007 [Phlomoides rotata]
MRRKLSGTDIRGVPHITLCITIWKKFHGSLQTMLAGNSGIGFNTATSLIDYHNDACALIVKVDRNVTNMRYKTWPLYEDWKKIFGMERANGGVAEDIIPTVNNFHSKYTSQGGEAPAIDRIHITKLTGKKRSVGELYRADKICDVIGQFGKSSDVHIDNLVRATGYDFDVGKEKNEVFNILDGMVDIDEDEEVDVAHWFGKNANCLEVFTCMTESSRVRYVCRLLSGQLKF